MIGYIEGKLLRVDEDRILLLANQVGYEVLLPAFVMETIRAKAPGDPLALFIYYQQTERQPKPVLIGFNHQLEKEFFQHFISVEAIGAIKAVKAMTRPVHEIAAAIESQNVARLKGLKEFVPSDVPRPAVRQSPAFADAVMEVLVEQLGYHRGEARRMITEALERKPGVQGPESLLDEIFRAG